MTLKAVKMDSIDDKIYALLKAELIMKQYAQDTLASVISEKEKAITEKDKINATHSVVIDNYIKLYDGKVIKTGTDPIGEFDYEDTAATIAQLTKEIEDLDVQIADYEAGAPQPMIEIKEEYPEILKQLIEDYNKQIGYTETVNRRNDRQTLLDCIKA